MTIKDIVKKLHPLEIQTLPKIEQGILFSDLVNKTGLSDIETMRAVQWLQNKDLVTIKENIIEAIELDVNGAEYVKKGLPERRLLYALAKTSKLSSEEIIKQADIAPDELNICIGTLKKMVAIEISKGPKGLMISLTEQGKKLLTKDMLEEQFLNNKFPMESDKLTDEDRFAFNNLLKRKNIIKKDIQKDRIINPTEIGLKVQKLCGSTTKDSIEKLTPKMLKTGSWKGKQFRNYDIQINVPQITGGKRHFVNQAKNYAKKIWLELGFKEMKGPIINTSFWNFDALFTAQDHPVRDLQDTFYLKNPAKGSLPTKQLVAGVKAAHEKGGNTGSRGWEYDWNPEEAKKNVLRTHTTVLSALTLAKLRKEKLPAKFFSFGRCYRNEAIDWSHLFEFNQTDGIVIDENANFRHLLGYLKEFFKKMGFDKARFRPAHFPYTEPSVEIDVYHPVHKKWIELGGAGMFRPELIIPLLGKDIPVLAWGPGFDRIIMDYYKITDLRDLYRNDLKKIREIKFWMRD